MDRGDMNPVDFLDIRKAFDTVNHQILLDKLHCYGIGNGQLLLFSSCLQIVSSAGRSKGKYRLTESDCGVPQGFILGSLLFIIHMNDLPVLVERSVSLCTLMTQF